MKSTIKRNLISSPKYLLVLVFWQSRAMKTKRVGDDLTASFTSNSNFFCFCFTAFRFNEFRWRWRQNNETIEGTNEKKKIVQQTEKKEVNHPENRREALATVHLHAPPLCNCTGFCFASLFTHQPWILLLPFV